MCVCVLLLAVRAVVSCNQVLVRTAPKVDRILCIPSSGVGDEHTLPSNVCSRQVEGKGQSFAAYRTALAARWQFNFMPTPSRVSFVCVSKNLSAHGVVCRCVASPGLRSARRYNCSPRKSSWIARARIRRRGGRRSLTSRCNRCSSCSDS